MEPINTLPLNNASTGNMSTPNVSQHAVDFSTTELQQHKDREAAQVSVDRFINKRDDEHGPSTSVMHGAGETEASTSMAHGMAHAKRSINDDEEVDEVRDRLRYQHIRNIIKERQQNNTGDKFHVETGVTMTQRGSSGFQRASNRFFRRHRAEYRNVSQEDRELFKNAVINRLSQKRTGSDVTRRDRIKLRREMYGHYKAGKISKEDFRDFKKIISTMTDK